MNGQHAESSKALNLAAATIATGFGVAYLTPFAKATLASAAAVAIYWAIGRGADVVALQFVVPLIAASFLLGLWSAARLSTDADPDPPRIVVDELAGQWVALLLVPVAWQWLFASFLLFRLFDVIKPFGIRRLERLPGAWGIMLDDVGAGLATVLLLTVARIAIGIFS